MKRLFLIAMTALSLGIGAAWAGQFEEGIAAYNQNDYPNALKIFRTLATQGNASVQYNLGYMYRKGQGVAQDYAEAVKWYRLAAAQGHAGAQNNLGVIYNFGRGVAQDYAEAVKWYRLAAAQGVAEAQNNLGVMYLKGKGVAHDLVRAHIWFNLGAISGKQVNAAENRDIIAKRMTPQQIAQAQQEARDCQQRNFKGCD